jgi:hypothetical protein
MQYKPTITLCYKKTKNTDWELPLIPSVFALENRIDGNEK